MSWGSTARSRQPCGHTRDRPSSGFPSSSPLDVTPIKDDVAMAVLSVLLCASVCRVNVCFSFYCSCNSVLRMRICFYVRGLLMCGTLKAIEKSSVAPSVLGRGPAEPDSQEETGLFPGRLDPHWFPGTTGCSHKATACPAQKGHGGRLHTSVTHLFIHNRKHRVHRNVLK